MKQSAIQGIVGKDMDIFRKTSHLKQKLDKVVISDLFLSSTCVMFRKKYVQKNIYNLYKTILG